MKISKTDYIFKFPFFIKMFSRFLGSLISFLTVYKCFLHSNKYTNSLISRTVTDVISAEKSLPLSSFAAYLKPVPCNVSAISNVS
jgi:hypothetical protein